MSKTPEQLVQEISASIETMKTDSKTIHSELREALKTTGTDAKAAIEKAETIAKDVAANAQRIVDLEQKLADNVVKGKAAPKTLGDTVIKSEAFKLFASGSSQKFRIEANTITGQEGSPAENSDTIVAPYRAPGIVPGAFRNLRITDIVKTIPVTGNAYEYTRENVFTNAAAETAEGADKPESSLTFELINTPIRTIATFIKASKQVLDDAPALAAYIDTRLRYAADLRRETQIVAGTGTGQNISGMLASGNHTVFTPVAGENGLDSLNRAQAQVIAADYEATGYIMNPADWHALERLKVGDTDDRYIIGNPLGVIGRVLWGLPVVVSNSVPAGKFIAANFDIAYSILSRQGTVVEMFEQDEDNVQKNLITIRSENRAALASERPASAVAGYLVSTETA